MATHHSISPATKILDDQGHDWSWAFVVFRDIPGFSGHNAGSDGTIWSCRGWGGKIFSTWKKLKARPDRGGHLRIRITVQGKRKKNFAVHRLVLLAFVGPCPPGMEACHGPSPDKTNNRPINLRWDTPSSNVRDRVLHGQGNRGTRHSLAKLDDDKVREIRMLIAQGLRQREIAKRFSVSQMQISYIKNGKTWSHVL